MRGKKSIVGPMVVVSLLAAPVLAQAGEDAPEMGSIRTELALHASPGGFLYPRRVVVDGDGNAVVSGFFHGDVDLGAGLLQSGPGYDVFVAKWDRSGHPLWSRRFGGRGDAFGRGLAVDARGDILIAGYFHDTLEIGAQELQSDRFSDDGDIGNAVPFVAKLDAGGNPRWSQRFGGSMERRAYAVATDPIGDVVVMGDFHSRMELAETSVQTDDDTVFLAKLDATGAPLWLRDLPRNQEDAALYGRDLSVDADGSAFVTGRAETYPGPAVLVAKMNARGELVWRREIGAGREEKSGEAVVPDGEGGVFVAGDSSAPLRFELPAPAAPSATEPGTSNGGEGIFLVRLDAGGAPRWVHQYAGTGSAHLGGLALDGAGHLVAAGQFDATLDLGSGLLRSAGERDGYAAAWSTDGAPLWSLRFGDDRSQYVAGIAADQTGNGWVAGTLQGGGCPPPSAGDTAGFLLEVGP